MSEKPCDLFFDYMGAHLAGELRHAAEVIAELGIKYEQWEGQPIADQVKLHGCTNLPEQLPTYIRKAKD